MEISKLILKMRLLPFILNKQQYNNKIQQRKKTLVIFIDSRVIKFNAR